MDAETKRKISSALTGRKMKDETKRKISEKQKSNWQKVPIDPEKTNMTLDCEIDENNNLKKVMFNGTEIPM